MVAVPDHVFGSYKRNKTPWIMTAFNDADFSIMNNWRLGINDANWGAAFGSDSVRGWDNTPTPSSFTKLDALIRNVLDQAAYVLGIKDKDWTDSSRGYMTGKVFTDWWMLHYLKRQRQSFDYFLNPEEDSSMTTGDEICWSWDDLSGILHSLTSRKYPIFNLSIQLARLTTPIFKISAGYPKKGYPPSFYFPFDHRLCDDTPSKATVANFQTVASVGRSFTESLIHAMKISMPWKPFTESMIDESSWDVCGPSHELSMLYRECFPLYYYDNGSGAYALPYGDFYGGTHTTRILPIPIDGSLPEIFAFLPLLSDRYHATNNPYNVLDLGTATTTEDTWALSRMAHTETVVTEPQSFQNSQNIFQYATACLIPMMDMVTQVGGGDAASDIINAKFRQMQYPDMLMINGISQTVFEEALAAKLLKLAVGQDLLQGTKISRPSGQGSSTKPDLTQIIKGNKGRSAK